MAQSTVEVMAEFREVVQAFAKMLAKQSEKNERRMFSFFQQSQQVANAPMPKFEQCIPEKELFCDYNNRFKTFLLTNSIPQTKAAQVFLTSQSSKMYKQLEVFSSQLQPPRNINAWNYEEIESHMLNIFNTVHFVVRERFKFWTECERAPGETIQELASKMRKATSTCDFTKISNPLDEALRTNFMCKIQNEAVLKALFRVPDNEVSFQKAVKKCLFQRLRDKGLKCNKSKCVFAQTSLEYLGHAINELLMQYRRTPLTTGLSPCELLLGRQVRARVDILRPFISA